MLLLLLIILLLLIGGGGFYGYQAGWPLTGIAPGNLVSILAGVLLVILLLSLVGYRGGYFGF